VCAYAIIQEMRNMLKNVGLVKVILLSTKTVDKSVDERECLGFNTLKIRPFIRMDKK